MFLLTVIFVLHRQYHHQSYESNQLLYMGNYLLVNKILSKIEFKIKPNKNIRKEYLYRIKKNFYKLINHEKKFVNSLTVFKDIEESDFDTIEKLSTIDTMSKISIGFLINQICKNLNSEKVYLNM